MLGKIHPSIESDQNRVQLEDYIGAILQCRVGMQEWDGYRNLPVFLARVYWFFETRIGRSSVLFMFARQNREFTPAEIAKHLNLVRPSFNGIVAYSAERLSAGFRARLISSGVAFAVPGNQLFIPELAMDLREHFKAQRSPRPDRLSPSAQLVLFYHLLGIGRWAPTDLTEPLGYTIMTVSRAYDEIATVGLARIERKGRRKYMSFPADGRLLIDRAKTLLIRPERQQNHVGWLREPPDLPLAGEHALSRLSDLGPPRTPPVFAVAPGQVREFLSAGWVELREAEYDADCTLATWRYDPRVMARNNMVDPLSLFAQFRDQPDERLSMAADHMLEQLKW